MSDETLETQRTPEGAERDALGLPEDSEGGLTIPVPTKDAVSRAFRRVAGRRAEPHD